MCDVVSKLFAKKVEKLFDANADASGLSENASTLYRSVLALCRSILMLYWQINDELLLCDDT